MSYPDLVLFWPSRALWQNDRSSRWVKARETDYAKNDAFWAMREAKLKFPTNAKFEFTFRPPSGRKYDPLNAMAAMKAAIDGMAWASDVDDEYWTATPIRGTINRPYGSVEVRLIR